MPTFGACFLRTKKSGPSTEKPGSRTAPLFTDSKPMSWRSWQKARRVLKKGRKEQIANHPNILKKKVNSNNRECVTNPRISYESTNIPTSNFQHPISNLVGGVGVEPTIPCGNQLLRLARMPVPPPALAATLQNPCKIFQYPIGFFVFLKIHPHTHV